MAQGISLISGSPLIGCPIVYRVIPESYNQDRTFHRIIVRVYAALETDEDYTTSDFSNPVITKPSNQSYATQPSLFDISSALQAVAEKYEYTPEPQGRYPYIKFRVEAWDEWMVDGNIYTNQGVVAWPSSPVDGNQFYGYAFMGAFSDIERIGTLTDQSGTEYLNITHLSRKPSTPEVVFKDTPFVYPAAFNRGMEIDHISDDDNPEFISGALTFDGEPGTALYYDNDGGQAPYLAGNNDIVLLPYSNIETDYAYKVCRVEPPSVLNPTYQITWENHYASLGDAYKSQQDGDIYVATQTGWKGGALGGPKSVSHTPSAVGLSVVGEHSIYAINKPENGYEIRFVNGLGCVESVHVTSFAKKEVPIQTQKYTIARQETLKKFSRALTVKTEDHEKWTLTSGPLDEAWMSWYIHEFLMSQVMWIAITRNLQKIWIPCHVLPEETTTLRDTEKSSMMSLRFSIELDINGAI